MVQPDWRKMDRLPPFIDLMTICREGVKNVHNKPIQRLTNFARAFSLYLSSFLFEGSEPGCQAEKAEHPP
jgi:hypothetical protein